MKPGHLTSIYNPILKNIEDFCKFPWASESPPIHFNSDKAVTSVPKKIILTST